MPGIGLLMRSAHEWRRHAPAQVCTRPHRLISRHASAPIIQYRAIHAVPDPPLTPPLLQSARADRHTPQPSSSPPLEPPTTLAVSPLTSPRSASQRGESLIRGKAGQLAVEQADASARIVDDGSVRALGRTIPARDPDCICECVCVCVCKELDEGTAPAAPAGSTGPPMSLPALVSRPLSPREGTARSRVSGSALARCEKLAAIEAAVNADWHAQNTLCCVRVLRLWQDLVSVDRVADCLLHSASPPRTHTFDMRACALLDAGAPAASCSGARTESGACHFN